jgi:predicted short-subunit dehydrogenase-like oxidoreductase (DUF2520 family)
MSRLKIAIIGNGNAASFFKKAFNIYGVEAATFARRAKEGEKNLEDFTNQMAEFDLVILAVSDSAIHQVSATLPAGKSLLVHCSGALNLDQIDQKHTRRGVFYPLMSLKNIEKLDPRAIPFCLEADSDDDFDLMADAVHRLGATYYPVDSAKRAYLHLAAVFAQNFTNHLFYLAKSTLQEVELDFKILIPLIENSVKKLGNREPEKMQTGPAVRKDSVTIEKHLELINDPLVANIYKLLTESIQHTHDKKL